MPIVVRRPSDAALDRLLARATDRKLSYDAVGGTRVHVRRPGATFARREVALGTAPAMFDSAVAALGRWEAHRRAGMRLVPDTPEISVGRTLLVVARWTVAWIVAPCRIVYTTAEDDRAGFAYGTVEGHPEEGEESFHVERRSGGAVFFVVATYFRFADPIARLGGPVSGRIQARYTSRYLSGLAEAVG